MTTVERLEFLLRRAMLSDLKLEEEGLTRPVLTPQSEDTTLLAIGINELRSALYANSVATKTLTWYANPQNYEKLDVPTNVGQDGGMLARVALATMDPV